MNNQARLQALSAFLKARRAKLSPGEVGLPDIGRRRTPGLRREEVAQLAGVSSTWYTWLEQGRDIQASHAVLECVAEALRLTPDERRYFYSLAESGGSSVAVDYEREAPPVMTPSLSRVVDELRQCPTIVSDRRCQIVGWNEAAARVFADFSRIAPEDRNMIRLVFTRKEFRRLAVNWESFASGFLAIFRAYYGQYVEDEWYEAFLTEMKDAHPDFERLWNDSRVSSAPEVALEFRHAKAGKMLFHLTSLQAHGSADLRLSVYTPAADSRTEEKLRKLLDT
ncbi:helix-turn-helix transcriptional regulator [Cohnella hashimotonis]|uniref:Helix-turn-helix transcriptional regulator n=1 Tax=Cohnella hashimotonis TaxID=2826895 RepID=A0ABT6TTI4_9BACL|nr:helix-turn-helix transcriptional regulator [Cohnella hashimotonis]MDI4650171.1 helix-turn-helix transcriptional regulator [Cohnella hashimotonis]